MTLSHLHPIANMPVSHIPQSSAFVGLSLLDGGSFIADTDKLHADVRNTKFRMYNWAFFISHGNERVVWDLGLNEVRLRIVEDAMHRGIIGSLFIHALGQ